MALAEPLIQLGESSITFSAVVGLIVAVIVLAISLWKYRNDKINKRFPDFTPIRFQTFIDSFATGQVHRLHVKLCSECGLVYRLPTGTSYPFIVVHDPALAKILIEGSSHHGIQESDKSPRYSILTKLTNGIHTMLTKQASDGTWAISRKAVAPSFSTTNLSKMIPELQSKLEHFSSILDSHIAQNTLLVDLGEWMIRLTIDVLAASMFRTDFGTLQSHYLNKGVSGNPDKGAESEGQLFVRSIGIMSKEFMMRSPLKPWRRFLFWDKKVMKEIADAHIAADAVADIGKRLLAEYRNKYTKEELQDDKSILAHLIRR
jgi:Cytochrome P450